MRRKPFGLSNDGAVLLCGSCPTAPATLDAELGWNFRLASSLQNRDLLPSDVPLFPARQDIISPAMKMWSIISSRGWRNRRLLCVHPGWLELSHVVPSVWTVQRTVLHTFIRYSHFLLFRSCFWCIGAADLSSALFWVITQRVMVISYRRFGTTCRSHLPGSRIQKIACYPNAWCVGVLLCPAITTVTISSITVRLPSKPHWIWHSPPSQIFTSTLLADTTPLRLFIVHIFPYWDSRLSFGFLDPEDGTR
jgi:hypothetical protein